MTLFAVSLILLSACLHVVQHVALKQARDRMAFVWWMWLWAGIVFLPIPLVLWQSGSARAWVVFGVSGVSAVFEALYYTSITRAYKTGDLSIVYPLARGTAPLLILVWGSALLRERPSIGGIAGVGLIIAGLCILNLPRFGAWREMRSKLNQGATRWALLAGVCISLYTATDKAGVQLLSPLLYTYLTMMLTLLWLTPATLRSIGWRGLMAEWKVSRFASLIAGVTAMSAYMIVLYVMYSGAPASYVGATREISVVIVTVVGVVFLKEQGTITRVCGSTLIAAGVAAIAVLG